MVRTCIKRSYFCSGNYKFWSLALRLKISEGHRSLVLHVTIMQPFYCTWEKYNFKVYSLFIVKTHYVVLIVLFPGFVQYRSQFSCVNCVLFLWQKTDNYYKKLNLSWRKARGRTSTKFLESAKVPRKKRLKRHTGREHYYIIQVSVILMAILCYTDGSIVLYRW